MKIILQQTVCPEIEYATEAPYQDERVGYRIINGCFSTRKFFYTTAISVKHGRGGYYAHVHRIISYQELVTAEDYNKALEPDVLKNLLIESMQPIADAYNQMMEVENILGLPIPAENFEMDIQTASWLNRLAIEFIEALAEKRAPKRLDWWRVGLADIYWRQKKARRAT